MGVSPWPETKCQSENYIKLKIFNVWKILIVKIKSEKQCCSFFYVHGTRHNEFLLPWQTVNQVYCSKFQKSSIKKLSKTNPKCLLEIRRFCTMTMWLRTQHCLSERFYQANKSLYLNTLSTYSPDVSPCDFFLFPKLKETLKETYSNNVVDITSNMV